MQGARLLIKSILGFSILIKDTSTCNQGIDPVTFSLLDDPLYLLSYSTYYWYADGCNPVSLVPQVPVQLPK